MSGWGIALAVAALVGVAVLIVRLKRFTGRQELLEERVRTSETYRCVRPMLERCRALRVERVVLRPEEVAVTLYQPPGKVMRCVFEEHGLDSAGPEPLLALAQVVAADLPMLADHRRYFFKVHKESTGAGVVRWYEYMIQSDYKDSVLRADYDRER